MKHEVVLQICVPLNGDALLREQTRRPHVPVGELAERVGERVERAIWLAVLGCPGVDTSGIKVAADVVAR